MMNYNECDFITNFRGEFANEYATHLEYVKSGDWERDYFQHWTNSQMLADYGFPTLEEIKVFCHTTMYYMGHWYDGVESGVINPEAGVVEEN